MADNKLLTKTLGTGSKYRYWVRVKHFFFDEFTVSWKGNIGFLADLFKFFCQYSIWCLDWDPHFGPGPDPDGKKLIQSGIQASKWMQLRIQAAKWMRIRISNTLLWRYICTLKCHYSTVIVRWNVLCKATFQCCGAGRFVWSRSL